MYSSAIAFPIYHSLVPCIDSFSEPLGNVVSRLEITLPPHLLVSKNNYPLPPLPSYPKERIRPSQTPTYPKNYAYKNRSPYRQGTSASTCLLSGYHLPGHGVRSRVSLLRHNSGSLTRQFNN